MQLIMRRPEVNNFIAVSPHPNVYDFSVLAPCPTSGQVIYSENDELVTNDVEPLSGVNIDTLPLRKDEVTEDKNTENIKMYDSFLKQ